MATATSSSSTYTQTIQDALTTVFTRPDWCSTVDYTLWGATRGNDGTIYAGRDILSGPGEGRMSSCYPHSFLSHHSPAADVTWQYSPGVCAYGWSTVNSTQISGQTTVSCCPPSMTWVAGGLGCQTLATSATTVASSGNIVIVSPPIGLQDWRLHVTWASSDLNLFTPASAPVIAEGSSNAPTQNPSEGGGGGQLSTGDKAGIGVGVGIACILIIVGIFLSFQRKKRRRGTRDATVAEERKAHQLVGHEEQKSHEIDSSAIHETIDRSKRAEADGSPRSAELYGGWEGHQLR